MSKKDKEEEFLKIRDTTLTLENKDGEKIAECRIRYNGNYLVAELNHPKKKK